MQVFSPAHAIATMTPTRRTHNEPMRLSTPGATRDFMRPTKAAFQAQSPRSEYGETWGGSVHSYDPMTRAMTGAVSAISYSSFLEDSGYHFRRRQLWNANHSTQSALSPQPWERYSREDRLNVDLERHPFWVAKSPGTYDHTKERWNLHVPQSRAAHRRPATTHNTWDSQFTSAHVIFAAPQPSTPCYPASAEAAHMHTARRLHLLRARLSSSAAYPPHAVTFSMRAVPQVLDGNPVHNGMRVLSPARRRHIGGVGAEDLV